MGEKGAANGDAGHERAHRTVSSDPIPKLDQAIIGVILATGVQGYGLSQKPVGFVIVKLTPVLGFGTWNLVFLWKEIPQQDEGISSPL